MTPASFSHWVKSGDSDRQTRLHDEEGNLIPMSGLVYVPHAFISTMLRLCLGYRPKQPWISYRAQRTIARLLSPDSRVLEFGSGLSTVWFARRCGLVSSIEHDQDWYKAVQTMLRAEHLPNVHHYLLDEAIYHELAAFPDRSFDFILIDGIRREACATSALQKIKPGGWIYLDNSDRYREARNILLHNIRNHRVPPTYFTDFSPTSFVAMQGMLINPK